MGSTGHQALIGQVAGRYEQDSRVLAVAVFGSVAAGGWHELSDVDLDVVVRDDAVVDPRTEVRGLFGASAAIVIADGDSADVVLDTLEEVSIRWHALRTTSPLITASLRVVGGQLAGERLAAAGQANRTPPDAQRLLDILVREAIGAWKYAQRGRDWDAIVAVERARRALTALRGQRDGRAFDPAEPLAALATVLADASASLDLGPVRTALLRRTGLLREA